MLEIRVVGFFKRYIYLDFQLLQNVIIVHIFVIDIQESEFPTVKVKHLYQLVLVIFCGKIV